MSTINLACSRKHQLVVSLKELDALFQSTPLLSTALLDVAADSRNARVVSAGRV